MSVDLYCQEMALVQIGFAKLIANAMNFTHYTVIDGSKLRPKNLLLYHSAFSENPEYKAFESFASLHECLILNPEAIKERTEISVDEVEIVPQYGKPQNSFQRVRVQDRYLIKEGKEESKTAIMEEFEQAVKRGGDSYASAYCEGLQDGQKQLQRDYEALKERYEQLEKAFEELLAEDCDIHDTDGQYQKRVDHWHLKAYGLTKEGK